MGEHDKADAPNQRAEKRRGESCEVVGHLLDSAFHLHGYRCIKILQAPTGYYGIEAQNNHGCNHTHIAYNRPRLAARQCAVGTGCIGRGMTTNNKLGNHARHTKHQHTNKIDENEGRSAILTRHIGKAPYIAQAYGRTCRGKNDAQLSKLRSFAHIVLIK